MPRQSQPRSSLSSSSSSSAPSYRETDRQTRGSPSRPSVSDYIVGGALPAAPQPVHDPMSAMQTQYDALGGFFAGRPGQQQLQPNPHPHRHHHRSQSQAESATPSRVHVPPPYSSSSDIESLPSYTKEDSYSAELNRKLFCYGFLFFPLWIVGIIAPFVKPYRDPSKDNRSKEDQELEDSNMRRVEMQWAWRCGFALITFTILVIIAVIVGVTVAHHHQ